MSAKIDLQEASNRVYSLDEIPVPDTQPCIEAFNGSIVYQANLNSNFEDKTAFVTGISKYIEEAAMHAELV
jgi:cytoplasmic FMR1 interacting protein